jgi:hypothetical protein
MITSCKDSRRQESLRTGTDLRSPALREPRQKETAPRKPAVEKPAAPRKVVPKKAPAPRTPLPKLPKEEDYKTTPKVAVKRLLPSKTRERPVAYKSLCC